MLTVTVYTPAGSEPVADPDQISELVGRDGRLLWLDLIDPTNGDLDRLAAEFSLHPLAVEDARKQGQRPKLELYPTHAFVVAYTDAPNPADLPEVEVFIGPTWLVTVRGRNSAGHAFDPDAARQRYERTRDTSCDIGFLLYTLLDEIVDGYFDTVERAEDRLEAIEGDLFGDEPEAEHYARDVEIQRNLLEVRRALIEFRRRVVPLRDVVMGLLRREVPWVREMALVYMQDVLDHLLRVIDQIDTQRELLGNVVDAHLALEANHTNEVMKKMTSWGAILIVATLIAGIYGMNFKNMPELSWRFGYPAAIASMLLITGALWGYFRRKHWI